MFTVHLSLQAYIESLLSNLIFALPFNMTPENDLVKSNYHSFTCTYLLLEIIISEHYYPALAFCLVLLLFVCSQVSTLLQYTMVGFQDFCLKTKARI